MNNKTNKHKTQQIEEKIIINGSSSANFEEKFFKSSPLRLSKIYSTTSQSQKYLMVILSGMIIGFLTVIVLWNTALYSMGVTAITQGVSRLITSAMVLNKVDKAVVNIDSEFTFRFFI